MADNKEPFRKKNIDRMGTLWTLFPIQPLFQKMSTLFALVLYYIFNIITHASLS